MHAQRPDAAPAPTYRPLTADDPAEIGGYRLVARLGAGGMGRVYLAHTPGGRPVALKVVRPELAEDPEFRQRFAQEVASAQRINGLYTAQVVDAGPDDLTPWLATAYVPGPSLEQVVRDNGPLPERAVLLLVAGIAEALQAIHAAGVVHRDLKPANVLLAADGPRVIDFGIARAADASALTGVGLRIGSPGYMAPEQVVGAAATPATDVFALGALAAYVSGGAQPFGGGPSNSALYRVVHEDPDLSAVPPMLASLLRHCLAKRPEDRPNTARLIDAVHRAIGGQPTFTDGWLPRQIHTELGQHAYTPLRASEARTQVVPPATLYQAPTATAPAPADPPASRARRGGGRRTAATVAIAVLALLAGIGGTAYYLVDSGDDDYDPSPAASAPVPSAAAPSSTPAPTPSATPSAVAGYTPVYGGKELVSPDHSYEFDLKTGTVVAEETAPWFVGRTASEFVVAENNDAFTGPNARLTPADCLQGLDARPTTRLDFTGLAGRSFCVRSQDGRDLAVVRLLSASPGDGPVKVSVDYFRRTAD